MQNRKLSVQVERNEGLVFQGGGGLVQHLKKSYSLSDLTGEKEDENRNTPHMHDETDMEGYWPITALIIFANFFAREQRKLLVKIKIFVLWEGFERQIK